MLDVLYEDNHLLAVNKPAMLPTMGVAEDRPSLLAAAKQYIGRKYAKPGNVYLGIVSRLDAPVTGVVLMARTSKAAARLTKLFRDREIEKTYWALVEGRVHPPCGELIHFVRKDERHRRMHVTGEKTPEAQRAELKYRVVKIDKLSGPPPNQGLELLEIELLTGRKHQIRVQLAAAGWPVVGDRKYGSSQSFKSLSQNRRGLAGHHRGDGRAESSEQNVPVPLSADGSGIGSKSGIALHARRLAFEHPVRGTPLVIEAPLPSAWPRWVDPALGGRSSG